MRYTTKITRSPRKSLVKECKNLKNHGAQNIRGPNRHLLVSTYKICVPRQDIINVWCCSNVFVFLLCTGDFYCVCSLCSCTLKFGTTGISALKRHEMRASHIENQKAVQKTAPNLFQMMEKEKHLENATRTLELQTALFIVTKNLPFNIADDFIDFLKTININPQIQGKLRCHRTKCKALICNVIGEHAKRTLVEKLRSEKFSIMIDEATDLTNTKHLAICVRHKGSKPFTTVDEFLGLFEVEYQY